MKSSKSACQLNQIYSLCKDLNIVEHSLSVLKFAFFFLINDSGKGIMPGHIIQGYYQNLT